MAVKSSIGIICSGKLTATGNNLLGQPLSNSISNSINGTLPLDCERLDVKTRNFYFCLMRHIAMGKVIKKRVKTPTLTQTILCISLAGIGLFFVSIIKAHIT
ncbi:hypothetical protein [Microcoleus sp.]|uniref:hypothetical protein n=1 Tax=Microcoleus sp. TaxID=44472 RepID=UPI00403EE7DA